MENFYFEKSNGAVLLKCRQLDELGFLKHCFTTRLGGVSRGYFSQLNLAFSGKDSRKNVMANTIIVCDAEGFNKDSIVKTAQTHTDNIEAVDKSFCGKGVYTGFSEVDGLVTNTSSVTLMAFVADCVPVILADPGSRSAAVIHSGWRGTALNIAGKGVRLLCDLYGARAEDIICAIGPAIGPCCYEVSAELLDQFDSGYHQFFKEKGGGKYMLDLWRAVAYGLERAGVKSENIYISGQCSACNSSLYFSHRKTAGLRGNMAAMVMID